MTTTTEIRGFFQEAKLVAEQELKITERYSGLSKRASAVGIDWSQLKALAKASVRDDEDNGGRVKKLTKKAEFAHSYAVTLKLEGVSEDEQKRENHSSNAGHQKLADAKVASNNSPQSTATPSEIKEPAPSTPPYAAAVEPAKSLTVPAAASAGSLNDDPPPCAAACALDAGGIPDFLIRDSNNRLPGDVRS